MEKYSGNHPRFSGASSPLNDNLTNREIRKAEKAGKAYAQSMEVGISEKKKQRKKLVEPSVNLLKNKQRERISLLKKL